MFLFTEERKSMNVKILTYNLMLTVPEPLRVYGVNERCARVCDAIKQVLDDDIDIIVLNEVMTSYARTQLPIELEKLGFPYKSTELEAPLRVSGGVIIFSRWPIIQTLASSFGDKCDVIDCYANKGVVFTRLLKHNVPINVFATHLQADNDKAAIRLAQMEHIRNFIFLLNIPKSEIVILAGDLNVDRHSPAFEQSMRVMEMIPGTFIGDGDSFEPKTNVMVGNDDPSQWPMECWLKYHKTLTCECCPTEWLDYAALTSMNHLHPTKSYMYVVRPKITPPFKINIDPFTVIETSDVSDHYPVIGVMLFRGVEEHNSEEIPLLRYEPHRIADLTRHARHITINLAIICAAIVCFAMLLCLLIWLI